MYIFYFINVLLLTFSNINGQLLECSDTADCLGLDSTCENGICTCPKGLVFNLDQTQCLPLSIGYQADCIDDNQCGRLLGKYQCTAGKCSCDVGWHYIAGRCYQSSAINETCTSQENCFNGYDILAMKCSDGSCICNDGYYFRGDYDCRPESHVDEYCSLNSDCVDPDTICKASKCQTTVEKQHISYHYHNYHNFTTDSSASRIEIGEDCETNQDCSDPNSVCYQFTKKCICKRTFFYNSEEGRCVGELGVDVECKNDKDCKIDFTRCVEGKCYCRKSYFTTSFDVCQKPMTHENRFCNSKERCYVYGKDVICLGNQCDCQLSYELDSDFVCRYVKGETSSGCEQNSDCKTGSNKICVDKECVCPENFRRENQVCIPNIGAECDFLSKTCSVENAECVEDICQCIEKFVAQNTTVCIPKAVGINATCKIDEQCSSVVDNSECHEQVCRCVDGFTRVENQCLQMKFYGDICSNFKDCHVSMGSSVQCRNGICQCSADSILSSDGLNCITGASGTLNKLSIFSLLGIILLLLD